MMAATGGGSEVVLYVPWEIFVASADDAVKSMVSVKGAVVTYAPWAWAKCFWFRWMRQVAISSGSSMVFQLVAIFGSMLRSKVPVSSTGISRRARVE